MGKGTLLYVTALCKYETSVASEAAASITSSNASVKRNNLSHVLQSENIK